MATQVVIPGEPSRQAPAFLRSRPSEGLVEPRLAPRMSARAGPRRQVGAERKDPECDQWVVNLLPLVRRVALQVRRQLPVDVDVDDLVSAGALGLLDAMRKFDASKHVKLGTYAWYRIRGAMLDDLRSLDTASRSMRKKGKQAESVRRALEGKLRRPPSDEEMAEAFGVSLEKWFRLVWQLQEVGFDRLGPFAWGGTNNSEGGNQETLPAENQESQFDWSYRQEQREILKRCLGRIPERERLIVQLHYNRNVTLEKIADKLGVDESRVSRLHSAALARLRRRVKEIMNRRQSCGPRLAR
jgi:RNA polymerase sigma factor for flagellar operon FliA